MLTNERTIVVQFGDCDPSGITFNPNYFVWFDASVHALLRRAGFTLDQLRADFGADGIPIGEIRTKFLAPSRYGDELRLVTSVEKLHRVAFDLRHQIFNKSVLAVEAFETRVWTVMDRQAGRIRAASLPLEIIEKFSGEKPSG